MSKRKKHADVLQASAQESVLRCSTAPIEFDLQAEEGKPKIGKFNLVAYTGQPMRPGNWYASAPIVLDIAGGSIPRQSIPADHEHGPLVGHTTKIETSPQRIYMAGVFSAHSETEQSESAQAAREITRLAANGFPWQASMEFSVNKPDFIEAGQKITVNGRSLSGPVYVARSWTLRRISIVANGADGDTSANIAASQQEGNMDPKFAEWLQAKGIEFANLTDALKAFLKASWEGELNAAANPAPTIGPLKELRASMALESQRIADITRICATGNPEIEIEENGSKRKVSLQAHAIQENWPVKEVKREAELISLRASYTKPTMNYAPAGSTLQTSELAQVFEAALCLKAGISEKSLAKHYDQKILNEAMSKAYRGTKISSVMHHCIRAAGLHADPGSVTDDTIRASIRADQVLRADAGWSTLSVSGVLSNVANKAMLASYEAQAVTWPEFCGVRSHGDFKVHTRLRLDSTGSFTKVGATGELKHVGLDDDSYTNQLDTYGAMISLNRQMQINDDLGAFLQIPTFLGRMANIRVEEAVYVLLLSNPSSFFSAGNSNLISGGTGAMTAANGLAAITLAETKFSNMVDSNGKPIMLSPDRMLLGTVNYINARNIYEGRVKVTGENSTQVANNEHAGKYRPIRSPYVNNTAITDQDGEAITGQSSTIWWLFADPAVRAAIAVAFLDGKRVPTIESDDTEFNTLGMQWRAYMDFGVGMEDPKAAVQVAGA